MEQNTKKIYIILTYTGTILSKIIRFYTKAEFCHVSLSLDKKLNEMYSFGRFYAYNPFIGGFVHEGINKGTFKRFKNTTTEIYSFKIIDEQYNKIKQEIQKIEKNKKNYKFNRLGLFLAGINYKYTKENRFYCAEFIKHLVEVAEIDFDLPDVVKPMDFKKINNLEILYSGILRNYCEQE